MAQIGYVRVSTAVQDGALQRDALAKAGCGRFFEDKASGAKSDRPGLNEALAYVREGDVLVVWKLDRLVLRSRIGDSNHAASGWGLEAMP